MSITVSGVVEQVRESLQRISSIVRFRKAYGWPIYQSDEEWLYESRRDEIVCPICREFDMVAKYVGDEVPIVFPMVTQETGTTVRPQVHDIPEYSYLKGKCRCNLYFQDHISVLTQRLIDEMREVV